MKRVKVDDQLARKMQELMQQEGWRQDELAHKLGVNVSTVYRLISRKNNSTRADVVNRVNELLKQGGGTKEHNGEYAVGEAAGGGDDQEIIIRGDNVKISISGTNLHLSVGKEKKEEKGS